MPRKEEELSLGDLLAMASTGLNQASVKPNMHMYVPHDKQKFLHCSFAREKLFIGGNRSGKTVWNIMECVWWLTKKHPFRKDVNAIIEPIRGRLVCVNFQDGLEKIILPYFKQFIPASELTGGNWDASWRASTRTLTLANGSFIEFMSYDQDLDAFAGTSRHFVSFDEEPPQAIFIECKMRLMDTGGSYWISMTPVEGMTWIFYELYEPAQKGDNDDLQVLEIDTDENPAIDKDEIARAMRGLSQGDKDARSKGKFISLGGRVFPTYSPKIHKAESFTLNRNMTIYTSYDHGWRHPAAWLWHAVLPNGHIVTFHEIVKSEHTVSMLADMVKAYEQLVLRPLGMSVFMRAADPATAQTSGINGMSIASTYALEGLFFATEGIPKGPGSYDVGLNKFQEYLRIDEDTDTPFWTHYDCPILEKQMGHMHYEKFASKKLAYESAPKLTVNKKDDDAPDSTRYFMTLMPDLYVKEDGIERRIHRTAGDLRSVDYGSPWNNKAGFHDEMLPDNRSGEYTVYEGSEVYALENY